MTAGGSTRPGGGTVTGMSNHHLEHEVHAHYDGPIEPGTPVRVHMAVRNTGRAAALQVLATHPSGTITPGGAVPLPVELDGRVDVTQGHASDGRWAVGTLEPGQQEVATLHGRLVQP